MHAKEGDRKDTGLNLLFRLPTIITAISERKKRKDNMIVALHFSCSAQGEAAAVLGVRTVHAAL
jgi:hypothetical protein